MDMKSSAELLGVSYGTLYGRYRETFGYLKHGWNARSNTLSRAGFAAGSSSTSTASATAAAMAAAAAAAVSFASGGVGSSSSPTAPLPLASEVEQARICEELKDGRMGMRQAAQLLGLDTSLLAYQLASKVFFELFSQNNQSNNLIFLF